MTHAKYLVQLVFWTSIPKSHLDNLQGSVILDVVDLPDILAPLEIQVLMLFEQDLVYRNFSKLFIVGSVLSLPLSSLLQLGGNLEELLLLLE